MMRKGLQRWSSLVQHVGLERISVASAGDELCARAYISEFGAWIHTRWMGLFA